MYVYIYIYTHICLCIYICQAASHNMLLTCLPTSHKDMYIYIIYFESCLYPNLHGTTRVDATGKLQPNWLKTPNSIRPNALTVQRLRDRNKQSACINIPNFGGQRHCFNGIPITSPSKLIQPSFSGLESFLMCLEGLRSLVMKLLFFIFIFIFWIPILVGEYPQLSSDNNFS